MATTASTKQSSKPTIMLVDGYGLIFRAFYAIQTGMSTSSGELTNAVYGFASMLFNVLNNQQPDYAVVALESGPTFRHEEYEDYKANRAEMPADLRSQVGRIRELIQAMNIPIVEREKYEADDVIGSLAKSFAHDHGFHVVVITGDTDLLQLVEDDVDVVLPGPRRFEDLRWYNPAAVVDRYGFDPPLVADYKALVGDTSDNIPGVAGIGDKTARNLISTYGDIDAIYDHVEDIAPARAKNALEKGHDSAVMSKHLATIVRDIDIDIDTETALTGDFDHDEVVRVLQELEFRSLLERVPESARHGAPVRNDPPEANRRLITDLEALDAFMIEVRKSGELTIDVETTAADPMQATLVGIALAYSPSESAYVPLSHPGEGQLAVETVRQALDPVLSDPDMTIIAHHGKYDMTVMQRAGFCFPRLSFDSMIAAYLVGESQIGLKDLAFTRLGIQMTEISELIGKGKNQLTMETVAADTAGEYACGDVESTAALRDIYQPELVSKEMTSLFDDIELPLVPILAQVEQTGVAIDTEYLDELAGEISADLHRLQQGIYEHAGREFNINSTRQLAPILFEELGLTAGRRTKTGYSVDQQVLESIRLEHPIVQMILEYRSLGKLLSTYVEALPQEVLPETGRIHTSYNQTVAATGRLSSANPNLQNIPVRTELGRRVRRAFVADHRKEHQLFPDAVFLSADYSQIELRLMAHLSQDPFLLDAFKNNEDIHRATAALVYDVPQEDVTSDMRRVAKTVNFGLLYGMQAFGLARDTGLSREEASAFIKDYWARLPAVRAYLDKTLEFGAEHGYVQTLSGRRRLLPELTSSNPMRRGAAERMAINMPVQGTAADIMKIAMIKTATRIASENLDARIILQVHDELVLEVDKPHVEAAAHSVKEEMENAFAIDVPLTTELQAGMNWDEMEPLELN